MFLVEQAFLGREEIQAPLKTPAGWGGGYLLWEPFQGFSMREGGGLDNECWRCEFLGRFGVILPQILKSIGSEVSIYPALGTQARFLYKLSMCGKKAHAGKNVKNR